MTAALKRESRVSMSVEDAADRKVDAPRKYPAAEGKANNSPPAPWFRFFAADFVTSTRDLSAAEVGIFIRLLAHMHLRGEPVGEDHSRLARQCVTSKAAFTRTIQMLLADGRIVRKNGGLWSEYIQAEIDHREKRAEVASKNASLRWGKIEQNQYLPDAKAYKSSESREEEGNDLSDRSPSSSSSYTFNDDSRSTLKGSARGDARPSVASPAVKHQYRVQEDVDFKGVGPSTVVSITIVNTTTFVRFRSHDDGSYFVGPVGTDGLVIEDRLAWETDNEA